MFPFIGNPAKTDRNTAVVAMRQTGASFAAIGRAFGISRRTVEQILTRRKRGAMPASLEQRQAWSAKGGRAVRR